MATKALMTENYPFQNNGIRLFLLQNERYDVLEESIEQIENGTIVIYHSISYNEAISTMVPEDYCVIVEEEYLQQDKTMLDRFVRERTDPTVNYKDAYEEILGIRINPYCDVDASCYQEKSV